MDFPIIFLHFLILAFLCVFGAHRLGMVWLYYRHRSRPVSQPVDPAVWPKAAVQLPIYNEYEVIPRLLSAASEIDYPTDRFEIQLLDDSTDETREIAEAWCDKLKASGCPIVHIRREGRAGYKAGALAHGMTQTDAEFIAVFDADFVPPRDFLKRTIPHFADPDIGMVQARWGHLNRNYSLLTRIQALLLDGHFVMEHGARWASNRFFNFNGTAGVWRREAMESAGGWSADTLTEDLDLSYRAQLKGWRFVYLPDLVAPAELPIEMNAFKSQQFRWAKGSIQTAKKLLGAVWRSSVGLPVKIEATFHLTANLAYLLMVFLTLLYFPALRARLAMSDQSVFGWVLLGIDMVVIALATGCLAIFYMASQRESGAGWKRTILFMPALMAVGVGLAISNSRAVIEGFTGKPSGFIRTPKYNVTVRTANAAPTRYRASGGPNAWMEIALGIYSVTAFAWSLHVGLYGSLPFLSLFVFGYFYAGIHSLRRVPNEA